MANARVRGSDIQLGQALKWDVYDNSGLLLLSRGYVINNDAQLDRLVRFGLYADADALARTRNEPVVEETRQPSVSATLNLARRKLDALIADVEGAVRQGRLVPALNDVAGQIDAACSQDANVALAMILLRQEGRYATRHMVNVATVVRLVARNMGLSAQQEGALVAAALTMNITMVDFQDELKSQNAPLTPTQRTKLERHPMEARDLLLRAGVTDPVWLSAVAQHHEHHDGSGYPGHLSGTALEVYGQLLALADIFCARITPAAYRPAVASNVALRGILMERGKSFDPAVAGVFIKTLGVFPPGMLVRLVNGEVGVVVKPGSGPQNPLVASYINAKGTPMNVVLRRDTSQEAYAIAETVDPKSFSAYVNMEAIWGLTASAVGPEARPTGGYPLSSSLAPTPGEDVTPSASLREAA
ncbi:MAG: HD domain-containing protein [Burkholderiales bacterium]|nr:HD domain-containing protein [Burkholderiales bacterium]